MGINNWKFGVFSGKSYYSTGQIQLVDVQKTFFLQAEVSEKLCIPSHIIALLLPNTLLRWPIQLLEVMRLNHLIWFKQTTLVKEKNYEIHDCISEELPINNFQNFPFFLYNQIIGVLVPSCRVKTRGTWVLHFMVFSGNHETRNCNQLQIDIWNMLYLRGIDIHHQYAVVNCGWWNLQTFSHPTYPIN